MKSVHNQISTAAPSQREGGEGYEEYNEKGNEVGDEEDDEEDNGKDDWETDGKDDGKDDRKTDIEGRRRGYVGVSVDPPSGSPAVWTVAGAKSSCRLE